MKKTLIPCVLAVFLAACEGQNMTDTALLSGNFIDSAVKGLAYKTETQNGVTDEAGRFTYRAGEEVEFWLGQIALGKAVGSAVLYPQDINADYALNMARLLQTLDADANTDNGIDVSAIDPSLTVGQTIHIVDQALVNYLRGGDTSRALVSAEQAQAHLDRNKGFGDAETVGNGQLNIAQTFTQPMLDAGYFKLSTWLARKSISGALMLDGQAVTSVSADMTFGAAYAPGDTGQANENGRDNGTRTRLRAGVYMLLRDFATGHSLGFYTRIEKGRGVDASRLIYKAFVEHVDPQGHIQERVYTDLDAHSCETAPGQVENQNLAIKKDGDMVTLSCGDKVLANISIADVLANSFGASPTDGFVVRVAGLQVQQKNPAVGSVTNPSFGAAYINGALVDGFSDGAINRDVWTYTQARAY